jgi:hypothetical protein
LGLPRNAFISVASGMLEQQASTGSSLRVPYLTGLLAAAAGYVGVALFEAWQTAGARLWREDLP